MGDYKSEKSSVVYAQFALKYPNSAAEHVLKKFNELNSSERGEMFDLMVDAGCGTGESSKPYMEYFHAVVGFDNSEFQVTKAKELCQDKANATFQIGDEKNIPALDKSVDLVLCHDVVHYMDFGIFMEECKRVLKNTGLIVLSGADYTQLLVKEDHKNTFVPAMDILEKCFLAPSRQHHLDIAHPASQWSVRYEDLYESVTCFNKERYHDIDTVLPGTLRDLKNIFLRIPVNRKLHSSFKCGNAPLDILGKNIKQFANKPDANDKDIELRLTVSIFSIFLTNA